MTTETQTETPAANTDRELTPVMRQYRAAKDAHPDALVFFRLGDFYELFYDDALIASRELQLTLTSRDKTRAVPMCGVPYHSAGNYLQRLLRKGYRVALCEQMEDPKTAKTIVRREVTRVLTPGTAVDTTLDASESQWLAAIASTGSGASSAVGVAALDLSTGEFRATEFSGPSAWPLALDELSRMSPAELIFPKNATGFGTTSQSVRQGVLPDAAPAEEPAQLDISGARTELEDWAFTADYALPLLRQQLRVHSLDGMGLAHHQAAAIAAGAIVHYLRATKQGALAHLDTLRYYQRNDCLELDAVSVRNLELVEPIFSSEGPQTTLFWALDACCTPMGKRLLRAQLLRPMQSLDAINARLDAVGVAASNLRLREGLRRSMDGVLDLERLLGRVSLETAGPREIAALGSTLARLPALRSAVAAVAAQPSPTHPASLWAQLANALDPFDDLHELIARTLVDEPPVSLSDGNVIREGIDADLDTVRTLSSTGRQHIAAIEARERDRTGIASLKVRFNSVFGYYIEVTKANAKSVPADYERKQTLVNAERFTTPELKDLEVKILTAQERSAEIERRIFNELRDQILASATRIRETSRHVAVIDLLGCFAHIASLHGFVRPVVDAGGTLEFIAGRHPVVERRLEDQGAGRFIPNSLSLSANDPTTPAEPGAPSSPDGPTVGQGGLPSSIAGPSLLLITGPNMGGKSTYLRQTALLVIMAQCGCFVPAESMRLGLVDRIYTRIGAADNVARGRSTFMVEMTETAAILNTATQRSLVLLDEMGRGTATYDGLSLAWATVEHLHDTIGARTLFATHYHELTLLADRLPHLKNLRVTVRETSTGIVFLHTVEPGAANKSYGIEVARLAGLPNAVITRAREVLKVHERAETQQVRESAPTPQAPRVQMTMFTPLSQRIVDRLEQLDIDGLTPREALQLLAELQRELKDNTT
jgi:DNA mismatch repair protein MutS